MAAALLAPATMRADEGMWLLSLIGKNYADMQKAGFRLSPEDIYSINQSCLKDAIVGLGNDGQPFWHFCTGEIISDQGLMTTNHHCGYGKLQEHSSVEHDYLRDGFWAYNKEQELPNPGLTASILVRMEDVTEQVLGSLNDGMSEADRAEAVEAISKKLSDEAVAGTLYQAAVKPMFNGNQYFLFVHIIYRDVRLVGAPPSSMGKFGGDTDNWSWPRHTCDFSMFRIYTAPDGTPAAYAKENVPLKPKHHLPVSIRELKEGDFAMVLGFPGTTNHYVTSYGLSEVMDVTNKLRHEIRTVKIDILRQEMAASQATRIKYASKYASCSNYWKYSSEQNKALSNLGTMEIKRDIEGRYRQWARNKAPKYAEALPLIEKACEEMRPYNEARMYLIEGLLDGAELPFEAYQLGVLMNRIADEKDAERKEAMTAMLQSEAAQFYKDYDEQTDRRLLAAMFGHVYDKMNHTYCPDIILKAGKKYKGDWTKYAEKQYEGSFFANAERFEAMLKKIDAKKVKKDPMFQLGEAIYNQYRAIAQMMPKDARDNLARGQRNFVDGIMQMNAGKQLLSPDANSTIRCTYGNVKAYDPKDGVSYHFYTTLRGVIEKEDSTSSEFMVPKRLKELYHAGELGVYTNSKGELPTCFITNNDITGGNSGSPVIDADGRLIGLAFDGNGEAMSGDIDFEENLQRCICLDTRYMLWVIDKFANAQNLIEEMDIVR
ncbi:MAG: Peptidase S46 [bacterium P3]|nr:MAG: Peptidase S46 [bacterium P3]KWW40501.1 MAG: Peptidase S46 [bacterium F083]